MTGVTLLLITAAAFLHATWNIAAKKAHGDARFSAFFGCLMAIAWAPLAIWMSRNEVSSWGVKEWLVIGASGVAQYAYSVVLLRGYRLADLSVVYPIARGSAPVVTVCAALLFLNESLSVMSGLGLLAITLGVFIIAGGHKLSRRVAISAEEMRTAARLNTGVAYGVLTGFFIAAYTVVDGYAVKVLMISPILLNYFGNVCRLPLMMIVILRDRGQSIGLWRKQWKYAVFVAIVSPVSYVMFLYAVQSAPLSQVAPARELSMVFAAILGGQLFAESDRLIRIFGAILIALGVAALVTA
jgi:drug/metabolite transporter (DMT)-like permease